MNFRKIPDAQLADFAANVLALLGGATLASIPAATRTALTTAFGTLPGDLGTQTADAATAEAARKSSVSKKNGTRDQVVALLAQVRDNLKAGLAKKEEYDLCGFDFAEKPIGPYVPNDPTDLSAFGYSNGVNKLVFKGNNLTGRVTYEIWRRQGDEGPWLMHAATGKQSFTDSPVAPGPYYEYKVRSRGGDVGLEFFELGGCLRSLMIDWGGADFSTTPVSRSHHFVTRNGCHSSSGRRRAKSCHPSYSRRGVF